MSSDRPLLPRLIAWALSRKPVRAFLLYSERGGPMLADSVTYRTLFSVFAGVLLGFSVAALWLAGNPVAWEALVGAVDAAVPGLVGADGLVKLDTITAPSGLTVAGIVSLVGLVGAAIGAIGSLRAALRIIAGTPRDDVLFVWAYLRNLALAVAIAAGLAASAAATFFGTALIGTAQGWLGLDDGMSGWATWGLGVLVTLALDAGVVALLFAVLSGMRAGARALWPGVVIGAAGLTVLQQLSGLFVGGAAANPLLASFAALIALLLWFNLSAQVILVAAAYVVTGVADRNDRVRARFGASTFAQRRLRRAEDDVRIATDELDRARRAEEAERQAAGKHAARKQKAGGREARGQEAGGHEAGGQAPDA